MISIESPALNLTNKLVAVVSEKLDVGTAMNAIAHMSLGLGTILGPDEAMMCDYRDASGVSHPSISAYPFIILRGRPTKIREAIELAKQQEIKVVDFTSSMTVGTYLEQLERTKQTSNQELEFFGAAFYGPVAVVSELTRKFSLYR
jgi:hypothetical protein